MNRVRIAALVAVMVVGAGCARANIPMDQKDGETTSEQVARTGVAGGIVVYRTRIKSDRVTCYTSNAGGISCLSDNQVFRP